MQGSTTQIPLGSRFLTPIFTSSLVRENVSPLNANYRTTKQSSMALQSVSEISFLVVIQQTKRAMWFLPIPESDGSNMISDPIIFLLKMELPGSQHRLHETQLLGLELCHLHLINLPGCFWCCYSYKTAIQIKYTTIICTLQGQLLGSLWYLCCL